MCRNTELRIVRHGFTMIELMVVVVIIAIAAAIVVPMASSAGTMQLRAAVTMMAADLEYAKSMSISRGQRYSVVFDVDAESYRVTDQNGATIGHPVKTGFPYVVDFRNDSRLNHVGIVSASFDGASAVSFDYLGIPYNAGASPAPLLNLGTITLQAGTASRTVQVQPVTGYISVSN